MPPALAKNDYALHVCLSVFIIMSLQVTRINKEMIGSFTFTLTRFFYHSGKLLMPAACKVIS
jgi:hypothetical protein